MNFGVLEDGTLVQLATTVVPQTGSGVTNSQISGLLAVTRATESHAALSRMVQHQHEKRKKEGGDRGIAAADFYLRLYQALKEVETIAGQCVAAGNEKTLKKQYMDRLALVLMTHVAAEHQWRWRR